MVDVPGGYHLAVLPTTSGDRQHTPVIVGTFEASPGKREPMSLMDQGRIAKVTVPNGPVFRPVRTGFVENGVPTDALAARCSRDERYLVAETVLRHGLDPTGFDRLLL